MDINRKLRHAADSGLSIPSPGLLRPVSTEAREGFVRYKWRPRSSRAPVPINLLEQFVGIADAQDVAAAVRSFIEKFGGLGLCNAHNRPVGHEPSISLRDFGTDLVESNAKCSSWRTVGFDERSQLFWHEESIEAWRAWSNRFHSLLTQALSLKTTQPERQAPDSSFLRGLTESRQVPVETVSVVEVWSRLVGVINGWLADAGVAPLLESSSIGLVTATLGSRGTFPLFGELVLQSIAVVTRPSGMVACSGCGRLFSPERRRAASRRRFCASCGIRAAWRLSKAEIRSSPAGASQPVGSRKKVARGQQKGRHHGKQTSRTR